MEATEVNTPSNGQVNLNSVLAALGTASFAGFNLNNLFGNNRPPAGDPPWARDMQYERELTKANAENGQLKAQIYCDEKINELRRDLTAATAAQQVFNSTVTASIATVTQQTQRLMSMTGLYINQPTMTASEAVANAYKTAAADAGSGSGQ